MSKRKRNAKSFRAGDRCKVTGTVGIDNHDDSSVDSEEMLGAGGAVVGPGAIYLHKETGEEMAGVGLDDGRLIAVPTRALSHVGRGRAFGYSRAVARNFKRVFGGRR